MEIFLDFDGTLAEGCCYPFSWLVQLAREYGYRGSEDEFLAATGECTDFEIAERIGINRKAREFTDRVLEANAKGLDKAYIHPNLVPVLEQLASEHILHVLSNRDQLTLEAGLSMLGLVHLFSSCTGAVEGIRGKPEIDLYEQFRTMSPARSRPETYVGDKPADRVFSQRAGLLFVGACWHRDALLQDADACDSPVALPAALLRVQRNAFSL